MSVDVTPAVPLAERSDAELIDGTRAGSQDAYGELWRRHANAGRTVARSITSSLDPDDLVSESFARIYQAVGRGKGPTGAFRPYLFTTIRNTAAAWGRSRRETSLDTLDSFEDPDTNEASSMEALDRSLSARAFRSLPTRWQEVLWYTEIEGMTPAEVAPLLGMKPNSVSALAYRAREGLREAWIQAHLQAVDDDSEHAFTISRLGSYARGNLSARDTAKVEAHLDACQRCTIVAAEAKDVGSRMALVLLPLVAGAAGATGYLAWLQTDGPASTAVVAMPATVTGGAALTAHLGGHAASGAAAGGSGGAGVAAVGTVGAATAAGTAGLSGGLVAAIGVGVVAAVTAAALVLSPLVFPSADPGTSVAAGETVDPPAAAPNAPSSTGPTTPATPLPMPQPTPDQDETTDPTPMPVPVIPATPPATTPPTAPPTGSVDPTDPVDPVDPVGPSEPVPPTMLADSGGGFLWPAFTGTGAPGATIDILEGDTVLASTTVAASETQRASESGWSTGPVDLGRTGTFVLTVRQTLGDVVTVGAEPVTVTVGGPDVTGLLDLRVLRVLELGASLVVVGAPNGSIGYTVDGGDEQRVTLDAAGRAVLSGDAVAIGLHELSVWGADPADPSRRGPSVSVDYLSIAGLLTTDVALALDAAPLDAAQRSAVAASAADPASPATPVPAATDPALPAAPDAAPTAETTADPAATDTTAAPGGSTTQEPTEATPGPEAAPAESGIAVEPPSDDPPTATDTPTAP
ncbi:sigma-70 family RNA polymerase sigma factor [Plantibacter sp. ME-Dv--P-095]|uniref:sigma-70 family RNA polymerase sigma factor n=1 Tax=Plantibacter sp. ME-Dv--P-095 TaxID=3040299 RepID=UPI00254EBF85|nr:sigma-70 family RNA polymerase sigma factor [Plantibacter sp. ME-Dv--P-095]